MRNVIYWSMILALALPAFVAQAQDDDAGGAADAKAKPAEVKATKLLDAALFAAIERRDTEAVKNLLAKGADPNATAGPVEAGNPDFWMRTPLIVAAMNSDVELVRLLLAAGADAEKNRPHGGDRPVDFAIGSGYPEAAEVVKLLIEAGSDPGQPPPWPEDIEYSELNAARRRGAIKNRMLAQLHLAATPPRAPQRHDPAAAAAKVRMMLERGVPIDNRNELDRTALLQAVAEGPMQGRASLLNVIRELIAHKPDLNARDVDGRTALHWAVINMDAEVAALLLQAGADAGLRDTAGRTPAELASAAYPRQDLLKTLGVAIPALPSGGIRAHIAPSRVEGVAPLSVFFQGEGTDGLAENDFVNAYYDWDFDTAGIDAGHPRRTAIGFNVGHVFREPGEYTVRLRVKHTAGKTGETSLAINVLPFTGKTFYVASDGDDDGPGSMEKPWKSFAKSLERAEPNTRVLLRRGDTIAASGVKLNDREGPVIVGAYTDPKRPSAVRPLIDGAGGVNLTKVRDWRFMDLHFRGTSPKRDGSYVQFYPRSGGDLLFWNLEIEQVGGNVFTSYYTDGLFVVDCHMHDFGAVTMYSTRVTRQAFIGNRLERMYTFEHGYRSHSIMNAYIAHNDLRNLNDVKSSFTLRTPQPAGRVVFVGNVYDVTAAIGSYHEGGGHHDVLIEGNSSTAGTWLTGMNFAVRNNRMAWQAAREIDRAIYRHADRDSSIRSSGMYSLKLGGTGGGTNGRTCENFKIYNNTYIGPSFLGGRAHDIDVYDNVIAGPASLGAAADKLHNNLHFSENAAGLEKWLAERRAAGQAANSKTGDPKFLSTDPASPDFLKPAPGGPGAGLGAQVPEWKK